MKNAPAQEKLKLFSQWAISGFLSSEGSLKKYQPATVEQYLPYIRMLLDWESRFGQIETVNQLVIFLQSKQMNIKNCYCACQAFFEFRGQTLRLPKTPKSRRQHPKKRAILTERQVIEIISQVPEETSKLIAFLAASGCRISEAYWLRFSDVEIINDLVICNLQLTKGGGFRRAVIAPVFPFSPLAESVVQEWQSTRYVFRRYWDTVQLMKNHLQYQSRRLKIPFSAHSFRHFFARSCLQHGLSLNDVQSFLGHKSLRTTFTYLQTNFEISLSHLAKLPRQNIKLIKEEEN